MKPGEVKRWEVEMMLEAESSCLPGGSQYNTLSQKVRFCSKTVSALADADFGKTNWLDFSFFSSNAAGAVQVNFFQEQRFQKSNYF